MANIGISAENLKLAQIDSERYSILKPAIQETSIIKNDGMILKITQDNTYDWVINRIDSRRIKLEKKAEIIHDFYGDRMIARDLFKDYTSYKTKTSTIANSLCLGLVGANMYTRVMKSSVLIGKVGTIGLIFGIQALSRNFTNGYLEKKLETPWKIHTKRMQKGLGPTNLPDNQFTEINNVPLKFDVNKTIIF